MTTPSEAARQWQESLERVMEAADLSAEDIEVLRQAIVELANARRLEPIVNLPLWMRVTECPAPLGLPRIPEPA